jgi:hypothetical protein
MALQMHADARSEVVLTQAPREVRDAGLAVDRVIVRVLGDGLAPWGMPTGAVLVADPEIEVATAAPEEWVLEHSSSGRLRVLPAHYAGDGEPLGVVCHVLRTRTVRQPTRRRRQRP